MIKELHGKHYYMAFDIDDWDVCSEIFDILAESDTLKGESFYLRRMDDKYVIASEASCASFRGAKYHEWERIKALSYTLKKSKRA